MLSGSSDGRGSRRRPPLSEFSFFPSYFFSNGKRGKTEDVTQFPPRNWSSSSSSSVAEVGSGLLDFSQFERGGGGPVFPPPQSIRKTFFSEGGGVPLHSARSDLKAQRRLFVGRKRSEEFVKFFLLSCSAFRCTGNKSVFRSKFFFAKMGCGRD